MIQSYKKAFLGLLRPNFNTTSGHMFSFVEIPAKINLHQYSATEVSFPFSCSVTTQIWHLIEVEIPRALFTLSRTVITITNCVITRHSVLETQMWRIDPISNGFCRSCLWIWDRKNKKKNETSYWHHHPMPAFNLRMLFKTIYVGRLGPNVYYQAR